jgi:hypothetical protein
VVPPRWTSEDWQLALLGGALWPAPPTPGLSATALSYALLGVADVWPQQWTMDEDQLALLGGALWPAPPGSGLSVTSSLNHALVAVAGVPTVRHQRKVVESDWDPLDTPSYLQRRLESVRDEERRERLQRRLALSRKVGVWSDDYSNLLSVFSW